MVVPRSILDAAVMQTVVLECWRPPRLQFGTRWIFFAVKDDLTQCISVVILVSLLLPELSIKRRLLFIDVGHVVSFFYLVNMLARFRCPINTTPILFCRFFYNPFTANPSP